MDCDHLGSTLAISCHKQTSVCADRSVYRYYRYSAYGQMKVYTANGATLASDDSPCDRMYTGQVWDDAAQMYYYNARFYDPKAARFLTMDPMREFFSPYAYVLWNPIKSTDPTGMLTVPDAGGAFALQYLHALSVADRGWEALLAFRAPGRGGFNGPNGGGPGGGAGQKGRFTGGDTLQMVRALSLAAKAGADPGKVILRSYAAWDDFGVIFGGDPNTDTARLRTELDIDLRTGEPLTGVPHTRADETTSFGGAVEHGVSQDVTASVGREGDNTILGHSGSNPAFRGYAPPIDVEVAFNVRLLGANPQFSAELSGAPFPNAEAILRFSDGNTITLEAFHVPTNAVVQHAGPLALFVPIPFTLSQMR